MNNNNFFEDLDLNFSNQIIFLDIDGTLAADGNLNFTFEVMRQLEKLKRNNRVYLCTNSNDRIRDKEIERLLGLPVITHTYKKPNSKIIDGLRIDRGSGNLLVIGDKFLTDGLFAWNIGARFIKTKRKISGKESLILRFINFLDNAVFQLVKLRWFFKK